MMMSKIISEELIEATRKLIEESNKFVILTHISPDGDAIGSSLGLYHFLGTIENEATVIVPNAFPDFLDWMKGTKEILNYEKYPDFAAQVIAEADLIFFLDFNTLKRIGPIAQLVKKSKAKRVLIDHHLNPDIPCDVQISYPNLSSTSELVFRLICRMGSFDLISKHSAACIYTGMMTDTGAFTYNSNDPDIYFIISQLLKKGIDKDQIYRNVYNNYSECRIRLMGHVFKDNMHIYNKYATISIHLSKKELEKYDYKIGDTEGLVNIPLTIEGIVVSVFFKEEAEKIKLSFRSIGNFPVNKIAAEHFNGGGHLNAAGGEFYGSLQNAIKTFEQVLPEYEKFLPKKNKS